MEVRQLTDPGDVLGEKVHRQRPLQRQIVQVVIEQHRHLPALGRAHQHFVAAAGTVHHHERVGSGAVDDAVIDELAVLVEHRGVHRLAGVEFGDVAGGGPLQQALGVGPT